VKSAHDLTSSISSKIDNETAGRPPTRVHDRMWLCESREGKMPDFYDEHLNPEEIRKIERLHAEKVRKSKDESVLDWMNSTERKHEKTRQRRRTFKELELDLKLNRPTDSITKGELKELHESIVVELSTIVKTIDQYKEKKAKERPSHPFSTNHRKR
jgi:hypothetical protein